METKQIEILRKSKKTLPFEALSVGRQKMRIVKDAIMQINSKILEVQTGKYYSLLHSAYREKDGKLKTNNLQKLLQEAKPNEPVCQVCAKGALFAGCVFNVNKVKSNFGDNFFVRETEMFQKKKLIKWFSPLELDMIETAFERRLITDSTQSLRTEKGRDNELAKKCISFGKKYKSHTNRLLAILNNILENKVFKP